MSCYRRGKSLYIEFRYQGRRYGPKSYGPISMAAGRQEETKWKRAVAEGLLTPTPLPQAPRFSRFAAEFLGWYGVDHRPGSLTRYQQACARFLEIIGDRPLDEITTVVLERYKRDRAHQGRKAHTINGDLMVIRHILHTAVAWGHLASDPAPGVRKLRVDEPRTRVLSADEEARLRDACNAQLRPLVLFGLHTGLRKGELLALRWEDIDWTRGEVVVSSVSAKSWRSRRIPLSETARAVLHALPPARPRVFGYRRIANTFRRAVARAGLEGVTPHTLRHTFATRCLEQGVSIRRVQLWLGHHSVRMTERYLHPDPERGHQAIRVLDRPDSAVPIANSAAGRARRTQSNGGFS